MHAIRLPLFLLFFTAMLGCMPKVSIDISDPLESYGAYRPARGAMINFDTTTSTENIYGHLFYPLGTLPAHSQGLVIMLPGFGTNHGAYEAYSYHLASYGYIVLGMNYVETSSDAKIAKHDDKAVQVTEAITYALTNSALKDQIDASKIAVMGHSLGGKMAFYAASIDPRIKTIIAMDPSNAGGPPCALFPDDCYRYPVAANPNRGETGVVKNISASSLIFRSQPDNFNPDAEFNAYYFYYGSNNAGLNGSPSVSTYIDMGAAPHASYVPIVGFTSFVPVLVKRDAVAWLKKTFEGADYSTYFALAGTKMQADISAGRVAGTSSR